MYDYRFILLFHFLFTFPLFVSMISPKFKYCLYD